MQNSAKRSKEALSQALNRPQYPRSVRYDPEWVLGNLMGPNVLWLAEALSAAMELEAGMRVLDLGCGRAVSSIFLAKEFGLQVWAADLWIKPSDNWQRVIDAGAEDSVFPLYAEAHALPFADNFFDAIISLDAYHYFGTDDLYLAYCSCFLKRGGQIGIVAPGLQQEFVSDLPAYLAPYWHPEFYSFHSPAWWREHWRRSGAVEVQSADFIPEGWKLWLQWLELCLEQGYPSDAQEAEMVRVDNGRNLGFTRIVARKK